MKSCTGSAPAFIKPASEHPLQPEFVHLLDDARESPLHELGTLLHSLYLYGSVSRAAARPGLSDLDLSLVLAKPLTPAEAESLERVRTDLEARHPEVTKVDFDIGVLADVLNPAHLHSWGYWLKHECRCIYGTNLALQFDAFRPSAAIAQAVNGDYVQLLHNYAKRISKEALQNPRIQTRQVPSCR